MLPSNSASEASHVLRVVASLESRFEEMSKRCRDTSAEMDAKLTFVCDGLKQEQVARLRDQAILRKGLEDAPRRAGEGSELYASKHYADSLDKRMREAIALSCHEQKTSHDSFCVSFSSEIRSLIERHSQQFEQEIIRVSSEVNDSKTILRDLLLDHKCDLDCHREALHSAIKASERRLQEKMACESADWRSGRDAATCLEARVQATEATLQELQTELQDELRTSQCLDQESLEALELRLRDDQEAGVAASLKAVHGSQEELRYSQELALKEIGDCLREEMSNLSSEQRASTEERQRILLVAFELKLMGALEGVDTSLRQQITRMVNEQRTVHEELRLTQRRHSELFQALQSLDLEALPKGQVIETKLPTSDALRRRLDPRELAAPLEQRIVRKMVEPDEAQKLEMRLKESGLVDELVAEVKIVRHEQRAADHMCKDEVQGLRSEFMEEFAEMRMHQDSDRPAQRQHDLRSLTEVVQASLEQTAMRDELNYGEAFHALEARLRDDLIRVSGKHMVSLDERHNSLLAALVATESQLTTEISQVAQSQQDHSAALQALAARESEGGERMCEQKGGKDELWEAHKHALETVEAQLRKEVLAMQAKVSLQSARHGALNASFAALDAKVREDLARLFDSRGLCI